MAVSKKGALDSARNVGRQFKSKTGIAIAGAFAFVMALAWNEVIRDAVTKIVEHLGLTGQTYLIRLFAAILITLICVLGILYFSKWGEGK